MGQPTMDTTDRIRPPVWEAGREPVRGREPTARMIEYLVLRANGHTQKEAARAMDLSVAGARRLDDANRERLNCKTATQAVAAAIARGLLVTGCALLVAALQTAQLAELTDDGPTVARRVPGGRRGGDRGGGGGRRGGSDARRGNGRQRGGQEDGGGPLAVASGFGPDWGAIGRPGPGLAADDLAGRLADDAGQLTQAAQVELAVAAEREAMAWT